jgi:hypothetical protein
VELVVWGYLGVTLIYLLYMTFKIKSEDKAAFLNRVEKLGVNIDTTEIKDQTETKGNKTVKFFTVDIVDPEEISKIKSVLKQSPTINVLKEKLNKITLRELVKEELLAILKKQ